MAGILLLLSLLDLSPVWRLLLVGFGLAWLAGFIWSRSLLAGLSLGREMRFGWAQVGDRMEERFTLANRSDFPAVWVEIEDHSNLPDYQADMVTGIGGQSHNRWTMENTCTRRGLYNLGPVTIRSGDPLGFYEIELRDPRQATFLVTPPVVPLPGIEVSPGGRAGAGRPRDTLLERLVSAATVREYDPGDPQRWIHWPTSARKGELYVRTFDSLPAGDWWILVDADQNWQAGQGNRSTAEHAITLAASLADQGLGARRAVGLVAYSDPFIFLPPQHGEPQRWQILRSLALLSPSRHGLGELLQAIRPSLGRYTSLVVITANTGGGWVPHLAPLLWRGIIPTVLVFDTAAYGASGSPATLLDQLARQGIQRYLISPELLDRPEARPGRGGELEWQITATGKAVLKTPVTDWSWRRLG